MGYYYIYTPDGVYFELDATTSIQSVFSGDATDFPLESGESVADHYVNNPTKVSFTGIITDIKSGAAVFGTERTKDTKTYIEGLQKLKKSRVPFTLYYAGNLSPLENCVFETLEFTQNKVHGYQDKASAYEVSFTAKQIRFAEASVVVSASDQAPEYREMFSSVAASNGNTQEVRQGSLEQQKTTEQAALTIDEEIAAAHLRIDTLEGDL